MYASRIGSPDATVLVSCGLVGLHVGEVSHTNAEMADGMRNAVQFDPPGNLAS